MVNTNIAAQRADERLRRKLRELSRSLDDEEWSILHLAFNLAEWAMDQQESTMAFNLQYLDLQDQSQVENRELVVVSNIMKTKHDTVKNSISNIR
jgi:hypothetical protein